MERKGDSWPSQKSTVAQLALRSDVEAVSTEDRN